MVKKSDQPFRVPDFEQPVGLSGEMTVSVAMAQVMDSYNEAAPGLPKHDGPLFKLHNDSGSCAISWCVWKK